MSAPISSAPRAPIEYAEASPEVRAVYDDIMATRKTDWINNFWKVLVHDPATSRTAAGIASHLTARQRAPRG